jgi:hypothetical protein
MTINFEKFKSWAISRFGEDNVLVKGKEIRLNSIFEKDDEKFHLWCSPSGGKKSRKYGVYHCFKTDKKGSLIRLVQLVDKCDRDDAISRLGGKLSIRELEKKLEEFFANKEEINDEIKPLNHLPLPPDTHLISDLNKNNWWRKKCEEYLSSRKIPINNLYICTSSELFYNIKYKSRIIIPYYDKFGNLIYWNARDLFGKSKCKYLGPPKEIGAGKEDVIFMAGKWPEANSTLHLCEGEFNGISLKECGFNAGACGGKNMGEKQALLLSEYKIVLCLDRDKAGRQGTGVMASIISAFETAKGREKLSYVMPPEKYNDWNQMLVDLGHAMVHHYVIKNTKALDYSWPSGTHIGYVNNLW